MLVDKWELIGLATCAVCVIACFMLLEHYVVMWWSDKFGRPPAWLDDEPGAPAVLIDQVYPHDAPTVRQRKT